VGIIKSSAFAEASNGQVASGGLAAALAGALDAWVCPQGRRVEVMVALAWLDSKVRSHSGWKEFSDGTQVDRFS
jgi:hypothetical protein